MKATILEGDVFSRLSEIAPGSVDCVVTSPPYFALRDYSGCPCVVKGKKKPGCTNCDENGKVPVVRDNQLGMEKTPEEYVEKMVRVFRLVRDCMSPWAVAFVNIGDSYASGETGRKDNGRLDRDRHKWREGMTDQAPRKERRSKQETGIPAGNLCLIPQRLALALQADGWIVRSVIVFHKPSPMPQSVAGWRWVKCRVRLKAGDYNGLDVNPRKGSNRSAGNFRDETPENAATRAQWADCPGCARCSPNNGLVLRRGSWRPTSSWEPVLMLAKGPQYFCDGEAVKQPAMNTGGNGAWGPRGDLARDPGQRDDLCTTVQSYSMANLRDVWRTSLADLTREELIDLLMEHQDNNLPDVLTIPSEPLKEKHYAAFPTALVRQCLRAGTSARGYCKTCGMPWVRVLEEGDPVQTGNPCGPNGRNKTAAERKGYEDDKTAFYVRPATTVAWRPSCSHQDQEPRPALVLDPFAGSGRTGLVSRKLGLDFVGVELAPEYVQMARRLLHDDLPLFSDLPAE